MCRPAEHRARNAQAVVDVVSIRIRGFVALAATRLPAFARFKCDILLVLLAEIQGVGIRPTLSLRRYCPAFMALSRLETRK
jgi:hypothetical protein